MTTKDIHAVLDRFILPKIEERHQERGEAWDKHSRHALASLIAVKADRLEHAIETGTLSDRIIHAEVPDIVSYGLKLLHNESLDADRHKIPAECSDTSLGDKSQPRGSDEAQSPPVCMRCDSRPAKPYYYGDSYRSFCAECEAEIRARKAARSEGG